MNVLTLQSTYGGLLHDTGKAVYRAGGQRATTTPPRCAVQQRLCQPIPRPISFIWQMIFLPPQTAGRSKAKAVPSGGIFRWTRCSPT